ncbi:MAG TPA: catalase [Frankiaceae bacterium]|nr:catalase [Frankiaceae bacterium]
MPPSKKNPLAAAEQVVEAVKDAVTPDGVPVSKHIPGVPGSEPPTIEAPTAPRDPLPPKADQEAPLTGTATGVPTGAPATARAQAGAYQTTATGVRVRDTDHSLKAGPRGPVLLQDHHLREKIMHFDHERIPERVVHARGTAAHGTFRSNGAASNITCAQFLREGVETPVFLRFSTVLGSRGSADTVRDTRGFATKFYTEEGNFDLVGNNMPVFFIQDGIKFPDIVHAAKPHPDREIPQAQSAHDTFWDFVSLHTEATHHVLWNMSDRGIPRSYRTMEGFGVHTFRFVNEAGNSTLVKFHWKPSAGVHSLTWEEAQLAAGADPDFHRRDLADAIEAGAYPSWDFGVQVLPDTPDQMFEGIDLLDPTKLVPEELAPVQTIGTMTLNGNPTNFFAETEQVAFHTGHLVRGIDITDDPLLAARNFSYLDTQLSRLGGPNFQQIPINRPHVPVNDNHRDGFHQHAVHVGVAPYHPHSLDGGNPFQAETAGSRPFIDVPAPVAASTKVREAPASFDDHFSQPRLFWASMTPVEKDHIVQAYTFELGKVYEQAIKERQLQVLANVDTELCAQVADGIGLPAPAATQPLVDVTPSPALSQVGERWPTDGRLVGILVDENADADEVRAVRKAVFAGGMVPLLIAPKGGKIFADRGEPMDVQRTLLTARSVEFDTILVAGAMTPGADAVGSRDAKAGEPATTTSVDPRVTLMLTEAYRHAKALGAWGSGVAVLAALGLEDRPGVISGSGGEQVLASVVDLLAEHRVWHRFPATTG